MTWLLASLVVVILGVSVVIGTGRGGAMPDLVDDRPVHPLPDGPITAEELLGTRLTVVPRGYSMAEVDELLQRVASQLPSVRQGGSDKGSREDDAAPEDAPYTPRRTAGRGLFEG